MPETLSVPKILSDRYAIEGELRRTGLAVVYLAREGPEERRVVLKVLRPELTAALGAERFVEEVDATAALQHENILPLIDVGVADGSIYYVTPFVEGETLRECLDRARQLPLDEALRIAGGLAHALDFAHGRGVIHGDVKPEKILLHGGEPLLADFAVARALTNAAGERVAETGIFGTPGYMSPEQLGDRAIDGRSDQYSLACVLYEMLAGEPAFPAPTPTAVVARVLADPPPRLTAVRVVPRMIERAIHKALSKAPADRFRTVSEFVSALHGAAATPALPTLPVDAPRPPRRWRAAAIALVAAAALGAAFVLASRAVVTRRPAARATAAHRQLTFTGTVTAPALSADGRSVAYVVSGRTLVVQRMDGGRPQPLVQSARSIAAARWTGDGRALIVAMSRDSTEPTATYLVPINGGSARKVGADWRPFDAGPNSSVIVRVPRAQDRIEIVSLATGAATDTIAVPDSLGEIVDVAWSPNRRWIAFTGADDVVWIVPAAGCPSQTGGCAPVHVANGARRVRWGAGSGGIYFLRGPAGAVDLMRVTVDPQTGRPIGGAVRVMSLLAADAFDVGLNRLVHTQTTPGAQARTFVLGGSPRRVVEDRPFGEGTARVAGASVSPDGRWVAYSASQGADRDIHIAAFAGGAARVVGGSRARDDAPAWSPDGARITFARDDSAGRRVVMADTRNGAVRQRVGSLPGPGVPSGDSLGPRAASASGRWSASGRHIAYYAQDLRRIAVVNLQRRNESIVRLPDSVGTGYFAVVPSPNGTQLLASTRRPGEERATLWLVFGNGRRWRRINGPFGESFPVAWHRNGWIYLLRNRALATDHGSVHLELWRMRGPTGRPEFYAVLPEGCGLSVTIAGDATRGVCNYVRVESDLYAASGFGGAR